MDFKESVKDDWDVFINLEEFADEHEFNGETLNAVVQSPTLTARQTGTGVSYESYEPITAQILTVFFKTKDLPEIPANGTIATLDGEEYIVQSSIDDKGILTVNLIRNMP